MNTFGEWLAEKRVAAGLNQSDLAKLSRVTKTTISNYEAGKITQPRFYQLDKIAKALGMPSEEMREAYARRMSGTDESHDILDNVRISFMGKKSLSDEEKDEILKAVRRIVAGIKAEKEA